MTTDARFVELQSALAGRYSILTEIGRGGMGIVYLAREVRLDRLVALKVLPPDLADAPGMRDRFLREARTAARLSQPNIVPIHAADEAGPFAFFAMAYVDGESLHALMARRGALTTVEATKILRDAAWALAYAHGQQVVHRDIKPDNILIERDSGRAMVADFGIARVLDADASGGHAIGTPAYMSPEQMAGEPADGRSDIYALGVVAFELLAGRLPFESGFVKKLSAAAPALASVAPGVPAALARIVDRCLQAKPADRFQKAEEIVAALESGSVAVARLPAPLQRWFATGESVKASDAFLSTVAVAPLFILVDLMVDGFFSGTGGFGEGAALVVALAAPMLLWGSARLYELRRVLRAGFRRADLAAAARATVRVRDADAEAEDDPPTPVARRVDIAGRVGAAAGLVAGGFLLSSFIVADSHGQNAIELLSGAYTMAASLVASWRVLSSGRFLFRHKALGLRAKFWETRLGRLVASIGGAGLPPGGGTAALANRPTEMAIGGAAEALYEALPREAQKRLPDLMDVVRRLEDRARAARAAGDTERLADVVTVLENIRLDLLRLGADTRGGVTADLEAAGRVGAEIETLLEGRRAAERLLGDPTPV